MGEWKVDGARFSKMVFDDKTVAFYYEGEDAHRELYYYFLERRGPLYICIDDEPQDKAKYVRGADMFGHIYIENIKPIPHPTTFVFNDFKNFKSYNCTKQ